MKVRFPTVLTRGFLFSALSASCQLKQLKEAVRVAKFANKEYKKASGTRVLVQQCKISFIHARRRLLITSAILQLCESSIKFLSA